VRDLGIALVGSTIRQFFGFKPEPDSGTFRVTGDHPIATVLGEFGVEDLK
jgi:hypothetical protein